MKFKKLKELRIKNKLKQKDIANILKVERSTYTGWEIGKSTIPLKHLTKLCNYYKSSIDYITGISNKNEWEFLVNDSIVIGNNIKQLRIQNKLKQKDIYSFLKVSSSNYSAYETGKILISTEVICKIAKKYSSSIDNLFKKNNQF